VVGKVKRNPSLSLRAGDSMAGVRMDAINKDNLDNYFDQLKKVFDEGDFWNHPEAIYNLDETGVPLEPCPPKIVARRSAIRPLAKHNRLLLLAVEVPQDSVYPLYNFCCKESESFMVQK